MKNKVLWRLIFLIIFALLIIYLLLKEFSQPSSKPIYWKNKISEKQINWQGYLIDIKNLILEKFRDLPPNIKISIEETVDIDNDDINEALINLNYGGAATKNYLWVKFKNGNIEIVKFKEKDGNIKEKIFNQGIGGGGRYGFESDFLANEKTILQASFYAYNYPEDFCKVEAYVYDKSTDLFEYNEEKSKLLTEKYCKNLCNSIDSDLKEYFVDICK